MATIDKLVSHCEKDAVLLGAIQELKILREQQDFEIKSAAQFLGNSQFKQLCHMTSELVEVWKAWAIYRLKPSFINKKRFISEIIDLQGSSQTMLEGPIGLNMYEIQRARAWVWVKNKIRGYDRKKDGK